MNLAEVLVAALVFAIAGGSSLRVWGGSAASSQSAQQQEQWLVQIDADLQRSEGALRHVAATSGPLENCDVAVDLMQKTLMQEALASSWVDWPRDVSRQLWPQRLQLDGASVLVLVLRYGLQQETANPVFQRERFLTPQAYGLCGGSTDLAQQQLSEGLQ